MTPADGGRSVREREIARLADAIVDEWGGAGVRLMQIDGGIGSGKSAFLAELLGAAVARGIAPERVLRADGMLRAPGDRYGALRPLFGEIHVPDAVGEGEETGPDALAKRCADAMGRGRFVIAVDDADRLGSDELAVLMRLLALPTSPPLTLVLAHRGGRAVRDVLTAARNRGALHEHVALGPLGGDELRRLVAGLEPHQTELAIAASSGNPLFARVLHDAFRRSPEAHDADEALRRAARYGAQVLLAAVAHDLDAMGELPRRVLEALAVVSGDAADAERVSGLSRDEVAEGERTLRDLGLLPTDPGDALHPVIRHSVLMQIDDGARTAMHRAAARLPDTTRTERAERLAQIGRAMSPEEAAELIGIATAPCEELPVAAARWLSAVPRRDGMPQARRALARALLRSGAADDALAAAQGAIAAAGEEAGSSGPSADALLARALLAVGRYDEAKRALAAMRDRGDAMSPATAREAADALMLIDGALDAELLGLLRDSDGGDELVARTYEVFTLLTGGETTRARALFDGVAASWRAMPDETLPRLLVPLLFAAWSAHVLERFEDCRRLSGRGIAVSRRHGRADALAILCAASAFSMMHLGRLEDADEAAAAGRRVADRCGPQGATAIACSALVVSAHARRAAGGDPEQLRERYEALAAAELPRMTWWRRVALSARSRASAVLGAPEETSPELTSEAVDAMTPLRYSDAARTADEAGDAELAAHLRDQGRAIAAEQGLRGQEAMIDVQEAETLLRERSVLEAKNLLEAARPVFADLDMVMLHGHVQHLLARTDELLGRRSELFASLTERELQVAELVAAGRKNREISARLVISPRTAENHVANVLRKLGIGNRQDLAALLAGEDGA